MDSARDVAAILVSFAMACAIDDATQSFGVDENYCMISSCFECHSSCAMARVKGGSQMFQVWSVRQVLQSHPLLISPLLQTPNTFQGNRGKKGFHAIRQLPLMLVGISINIHLE